MTNTEFIKTVLQELTGNSAIDVTETLQDEKILISIKAPKEIRGKIIGKGGATISALRTLVIARSSGGSEKQYFLIKIED